MARKIHEFVNYLKWVVAVLGRGPKHIFEWLHTERVHEQGGDANTPLLLS